MNQANSRTLRCLAALWLSLGFAGNCPAADRYVYEYKGEKYPYSVEQTGENYTFEFEGNPGSESGKRRATLHVFQSVYGDYSIRPAYADAYMKEGATCFVFDASLYSYRACFLPNDFSTVNHPFWGFVSRLPSGMWFLTRQAIPAALGLGLLAFLLGKRNFRAR
jgi:hypothetical protein